MSDVADELREETEKWMDRLDEALDEMPDPGQTGRQHLSNVQAYRDDADHFLDEGDLVRAFEAVVWAWAWLEIGQEQGLLPETG